MFIWLNDIRRKLCMVSSAVFYWQYLLIISLLQKPLVILTHAPRFMKWPLKISMYPCYLCYKTQSLYQVSIVSTWNRTIGKVLRQSISSQLFSHCYFNIPTTKGPLQNKALLLNETNNSQVLIMNEMLLQRLRLCQWPK